MLELGLGIQAIFLAVGCRQRRGGGFGLARRGEALGLRGFGFWSAVMNWAGIHALGLGIAVDQLDHRHRRGVAVAEARP